MKYRFTEKYRSSVKNLPEARMWLDFNGHLHIKLANKNGKFDVGTMLNYDTLTRSAVETEALVRLGVVEEDV